MGGYKSRRERKRVGQRVTRMFEIVPKFSEIYQKERKKRKTPPFPSLPVRDEIHKQMPHTEVVKMKVCEELMGKESHQELAGSRRGVSTGRAW